MTVSTDTTALQPGERAETVLPETGDRPGQLDDDHSPDADVPDGDAQR